MSKNKWNVTSAYGSKGRILGKWQMCRWMSKVEYISKSCLSRSALIIQLNIFKYIDVVSRKFFPNLRIDEGTSLWRNRLDRIVIESIDWQECG